MKPIHYMLIIGGTIAAIAIVVLLTQRAAPAAPAQPTNTTGGDVGVAIAGLGAGLGSLFGAIAQNEINQSNARAAAEEN